jgi:hypothetical protein
MNDKWFDVEWFDSERGADDRQRDLGLKLSLRLLRLKTRLYIHFRDTIFGSRVKQASATRDMKHE